MPETQKQRLGVANLKTKQWYYFYLEKADGIPIYVATGLILVLFLFCVNYCCYARQ